MQKTRKLSIVRSYLSEKHNNINVFLLQLPSHRFQYSVWHDLKVVSIKGTDLKAPRIRDGMAIKRNF